MYHRCNIKLTIALKAFKYVAHSLLPITGVKHPQTRIPSLHLRVIKWNKQVAPGYAISYRVHDPYLITRMRSESLCLPGWIRISRSKLPPTTSDAIKNEALNAKASQQTPSPGAKSIEGSIPPGRNVLFSLGPVEVLPTFCFPVNQELSFIKTILWEICLVWVYVLCLEVIQSWLIRIPCH